MKRRSIMAGLLCAVVWSGCSHDAGAPGLRLNQAQVLGTHNSYHIQPGEVLFGLISDFDPAIAAAMEYNHVPLGEQFESRGIRQIEGKCSLYPDWFCEAEQVQNGRVCGAGRDGADQAAA